jgi:hypothetical protein
MQNKKLIINLGILVLLVGSAAFVAGRMLNNKVNPLGLFGLGGKGNMMSVSVNIIPAEELPKTQAEVIGQFLERKDNTIVVQPIPLKLGAGGIVARSSAGTSNASEVEVVITNETIIYRDTTTDFNVPPGDAESLQQTVEESTLDDLNTESTISAWGHKSGDRIIAEVLVYSNPVAIRVP